MKTHQLFIIALFVGCLFTSCKKDGNRDKTKLEPNTWQITPDDDLGAELYQLKTLVLRTNVQQVLEAKSQDNPGGGLRGINSSITLYFPTVGPPPSGNYKVTSFEKLTATDQVAIYVQTYGDPRSGGNLGYWFSQEGGSQTISYKFENGKASATFKDILIKQNGNGPSTGTLSANISQ